MCCLEKRPFDRNSVAGYRPGETHPFSGAAVTVDSDMFAAGWLQPQAAAAELDSRPWHSGVGNDSKIADRAPDGV